LDERKKKELSKVLVGLEALKEQDRFSERDRLLQKNRHAYRFQELKKDVILPVLREFMVDLDAKGHLTRLSEKSPEKIRLDVQIQTKVPKRGTVEFGLDVSNPGKLKVDYGWVSTGSRFHQESFPLDRIESGFIADRVLHLLQGLM